MYHNYHIKRFKKKSKVYIAPLKKQQKTPPVQRNTLIQRRSGMLILNQSSV